MSNQLDIPIPLPTNRTQIITYVAKYGTQALRPAAGTQIDASFYSETDTGLLYQVQAGAWVLSAGGGVIPSGATLPVAPLTGQPFLHTPVGRSALMVWDGANWQTITYYGDVTVYVSTTGTNDLAHGTGTGVNAFLTVQFAVDTVKAGTQSGKITIHIGAGVFAETVKIPIIPISFDYDPGAAMFPAVYPLNLRGTRTQVDSQVCGLGSVQGGGATQGTVVASAAVWVAGAQKGRMVRFTSGANNGITRIIDNNTTTTLTIAATWAGAPAQNDTFVIEDWGTTVNDFVFAEGLNGVSFADVKFGGLHCFGNQGVRADTCTTVSTAAVYIARTLIDLVTCYLPESVTSLWTIQGQSTVQYWYGCIAVNSANNGTMVVVSELSQITSYDGNIFDGGAIGTPQALYLSGLCQFVVLAPNAKTIIRNCNGGGVGLSLVNGAHSLGVTGNITYANNSTDKYAEAASFSYYS